MAYMLNDNIKIFLITTKKWYIQCSLNDLPKFILTQTIYVYYIEVWCVSNYHKCNLHYFWFSKYLSTKFTSSSFMLCVHTKFPTYYVHLVFIKSKYVLKIQMSQDVPNSKTIHPLTSAL